MGSQQLACCLVGSRGLVLVYACLVIRVMSLMLVVAVMVRGLEVGLKFGGVPGNFV